MRCHAALAAALALAAATAATAQEAATGLGAPVMSSQGFGGEGIGFTLRGGVGVQPDYFGATSGDVAPVFGGTLNYLSLGGFTFGDPDPLFAPSGPAVNVSFRYIGERSAAENPELTGLADVDATFELGTGLSYSTGDLRVFGDVRYGLFGHGAFVGELGADFFLRPTERITLRAGPRALFGTDRYADTYFGVTPGEAAASGGRFAPFDPSGGLISAGVELGAGYQISPNWGVDAVVTFERLQRDAADSPISADANQVSASIGVLHAGLLTGEGPPMGGPLRRCSAGA